ncbi:MAG: IS3 family transposase [Acidobacteriota bacterium]|nr:IS3 family transposase [Acidobacteriota bacterium]
MKRSRFTEHQIIRILKEVEKGMKVAEVCRQNSISESTYYKWKAKYGGMEAADIRRLKELEAENSKLKRMYADLSLECHALKDLIEKKPLSPGEKRESVEYLKQEHRMSERRSCLAVRLARSVFRYKPRPKDDKPIIDALGDLVEDHSDLGFKKFHEMLRKQGRPWNHKRVYRVYKLMKLNKKRRYKRRLPTRNPDPLEVPDGPNISWSCDFMSDALTDSRRFRTFNLIDDFNREGLAIEIDFNLPAERVVRVLDRLLETRGVPQKLRMDNGPEFTSDAMKKWFKETGVKPDFIEPGKPAQNAYIERFNRSYRQGVLDMYLFDSLQEVKRETKKWIRKYNHERPHDSLQKMTPVEYLAEKSPKHCTLAWS